MMREYRKYWLLGILGAACFGIGDWLLGYVDPSIVNKSFSVIKAGHGAGYDLTKFTVTRCSARSGCRLSCRAA